MQSIFTVVKENVTARQAAEYYGLHADRHGMAVCPFHNDRSPSMKLDVRFFCFACGEHGDVIDLVSGLFGITAPEAAKKIADDFGLRTDTGKLLPIRGSPAPPRAVRETSDEWAFRAGGILLRVGAMIREILKKGPSFREDGTQDPIFVFALKNRERVEYLGALLCFRYADELEGIRNTYQKEIDEYGIYLERHAVEVCGRDIERKKQNDTKERDHRTVDRKLRDSAPGGSAA